MSASALSVSVLVATHNRADYVGTCPEHLVAQTVRPVEIVGVDASPDRRTQEVVAAFAGVRYVRNPLGIGHTATPRAIGVAATTGGILAFVDDDAYAEPTWLAEFLLPHAHVAPTPALPGP